MNSNKSGVKRLENVYYLFFRMFCNGLGNTWVSNMHYFSSRVTAPCKASCCTKTWQHPFLIAVSEMLCLSLRWKSGVARMSFAFYILLIGKSLTETRRFTDDSRNLLPLIYLDERSILPITELSQLLPGDLLIRNEDIS